MNTFISFDYVCFIQEIEGAISVAKNIDKKNFHYQDQLFKSWKHKVLDLIDEIEKQGYEINCNLRGKVFHSLSYTSTSNDDKICFEKHLHETINELNLIVEKFQKYGDPKSRLVDNSKIEIELPKKLTPPEKITLKWLWEHLSLGWWCQIAFILFLTFSAGFTVGATDLAKSVLKHFLKVIGLQIE
jgi:hypothetical protein